MSTDNSIPGNPYPHYIDVVYRGLCWIAEGVPHKSDEFMKQLGIAEELVLMDVLRRGTDPSRLRAAQARARKALYAALLETGSWSIKKIQGECEELVAYLQIMNENYEQAVPQAPAPEPDSLVNRDILVLCGLAVREGRYLSCEDLASICTMTQRTVERAILILVEQRLAKRPKGKKKLAAITTNGKCRLVSHLSEDTKLLTTAEIILGKSNPGKELLRQIHNQCRKDVGK
jgi:hypothetical protein